MLKEKNRLESFFESDALDNFFEEGRKTMEEKYGTLQTEINITHNEQVSKQEIMSKIYNNYKKKESVSNEIN